MTWQQFERVIRQVASFKWEGDGRPREINGVRSDCVIEVRPDYWIVIEITQEESLDKLRTDLAKFASIRPYLFSQSIYSECYFVCESEPPSSLRPTGEGMNVKVLSFQEFENLYFDFPRYKYARLQHKFGSAVDPVSGEKDNKQYVPVKYIGISSNEDYTIEDIADLVRNKVPVVLLGDYGTGKSRCIKELFTELSKPRNSQLLYPIAIDLRDNWGTRRSHELIQRHFDGLGLSDLAKNVIKTEAIGATCFLLDGFDEIGAQTWSDDPAKLKAIRAESLAGVKDLIRKTKAGCVITGREHYFNSEEEMYSCLGLDPKKAVIIRCSDEFTDEEIQSYLAEVAQGLELPSWLPKRPLICHIVAEMGRDELAFLVQNDSGELTFWRSMISALCAREARINPLLDAEIIRKVLRRVARVTRIKALNVGPISIAEINSCFEAVTGRPAVDESAIMLQRLPGLGRLASESTERQFVDTYILDGLRAEDVVDLTESQDPDIFNQPWINPLRKFGLNILAEEVVQTSKMTSYMRFMKRSSARQNGILAGDMLCGFLTAHPEGQNFNDLELVNSHLCFLDISSGNISGLTIKASIIEELDISGSNNSDVKITGCIINNLTGVTAEHGLPNWMKGNTVETYQAVSTVSRIKHAQLTAKQRIFVTVVKKLFFQPGAGRQEEALTRGLGGAEEKKDVDQILKVLMRENIISHYKGRHGIVYTPERRHAHRMERILARLTLSDDPLWIALKG
jgi:hypothetical protein